jgi:hypothetical protein
MPGRGLPWAKQMKLLDESPPRGKTAGLLAAFPVDVVTDLARMNVIRGFRFKTNN